MRQLALQHTDVNGNYFLVLRDPCTYYIYETTCLGDRTSRIRATPALVYMAIIDNECRRQKDGGHSGLLVVDLSSDASKQAGSDEDPADPDGARGYP